MRRTENRCCIRVTGTSSPSRATFQRAIDGYRRLAAESLETQGLRAEIARTQNELGNVYELTNEPAAGRAAHQDALSTLRGNGAGESASAAHRYELARTYYFLARRLIGQAGPFSCRSSGQSRRLRRGESSKSHRQLPGCSSRSPGYSSSFSEGRPPSKWLGAQSACGSLSSRPATECWFSLSVLFCLPLWDYDDERRRQGIKNSGC